MVILGSLGRGHSKGRVYKEIGFVTKLRNNEVRAVEGLSVGEEGQPPAPRGILRHAVKRPRRSSVMSKPNPAGVAIAVSLHKLVLMQSLRRCKGRVLRRAMTKRKAKPGPHGGAAVRGGRQAT